MWGDQVRHNWKDVLQTREMPLCLHGMALRLVPEIKLQFVNFGRFKVQGINFQGTLELLKEVWWILNISMLTIFVLRKGSFPSWPSRLFSKWSLMEFLFNKLQACKLERSSFCVFKFPEITSPVDLLSTETGANRNSTLVDTRSCFNVYKTPIRRRIDVL